MSPKVELDDLIDTTEVAELLGLSHRNSVSTYLRRYEDMPRPVIERGGGRTRLWLRTEVTTWRDRRSSPGHPAKVGDQARVRGQRAVKP